MLKVGIIIGSTRPNRKGLSVGQWVFDTLKKRRDAEFELIDLVDFNLPLLDEPQPASSGVYEKDHTKKWAEKIGGLDAFIFVNPEYNHGMNAALKNALDFLYKEWTNKACGFVSYGGDGGVRAVEQLRVVVGTLQMADVGKSVTLSLREDFEGNQATPRNFHEKSLNGLADQVLSWGTALKTVRKT